MFGEQISQVFFATDFYEFDGVVSNSLLDPKALRVDVTQFAEPVATADAHGGNAVSPYPHGHFVAEVA